MKNIVIEYYINDDKVLVDEFEWVEKELQDNNLYHQNSMTVKTDYIGSRDLWLTIVRTITHNEDLKCGAIS